MTNSRLGSSGEQDLMNGGTIQSISAKANVSFDISPTPQKIISGRTRFFIRLFIRTRIVWIVFRNYRSIPKSILLLKELLRLRESALGESKVMKYVRVDGKYHLGMYIPGFYTEAFKAFILGEVSRIKPLQKPTNQFTSVLFSITKKCVLRCEHCFEWDGLNGEEKLSLPELKTIVSKIQKLGTSQIHFSGGEPLQRLNDLLEVLKTIDRKTESWVLTSGYNLTPENAQMLKSAGLNGIVISLDHFVPELHNQFRGSPRSFGWAIEGIKNSISAKLVTAISICVTNAFVTMENLLAYAEMAKNLGVAYIQIFEPRAAGHYQDKDVELTNDKLKILENFFNFLNSSKEYSRYPIVLYHGYYQRRIGCFSAGRKHIYIDSDGDVRDCPFCRTKAGNVLEEEIDQIINRVMARGCSKYKSMNF